VTGDPVEAKALSNADGKFKFEVPPVGRVYTNGVHVWAYQPGLALAAVQYVVSRPHQIVLRKSDPRTVKVEGPDGKPVSGARVEPRFIFLTGGTGSVDMPESLASALADTTGPDGTARVPYLRA
jgi:hypothetical protein